MKHECNVARDLMPLCIDGVASEESKRYVEEHIAECTECAESYGEMQIALPQDNAEKEKAAMEQTAQQMRRRRLTRKRLLIALTALLTALAVMAGMWGYDYATNRSSVPVALDAYDAYLCRTREDGRIIVNLDMKDKTLVYGVTGWARKTPDGEWDWMLTPNTTLIAKHRKTPTKGPWTEAYNLWYWQDGAIYGGDPATTAPLERFILVCGDEERVIYQRGDEIPFCSEEMEAYYKALDEVNDFSNSSVNRRSFDFDEREGELWDRVDQLRKTVPEWQ